MRQLNIKSDRADALVSRLVALTGEGKTQAAPMRSARPVSMTPSGTSASRSLR
jgi:hypothetical protein